MAAAGVRGHLHGRMQAWRACARRENHATHAQGRMQGRMRHAMHALHMRHARHHSQCVRHDAPCDMRQAPGTTDAPCIFQTHTRHAPCNATRHVWTPHHAPCNATRHVWTPHHAPCNATRHVWTPHHAPCNATRHVWTPNHAPYAGTACTMRHAAPCVMHVHAPSGIACLLDERPLRCSKGQHRAGGGKYGLLFSCDKATMRLRGVGGSGGCFSAATMPPWGGPAFQP
eukprot:362554-Chlamydomonas_euryale.AAC.2